MHREINHSQRRFSKENVTQAYMGVMHYMGPSSAFSLDCLFFTNLLKFHCVCEHLCKYTPIMHAHKQMLLDL